MAPYKAKNPILFLACLCKSIHFAVPQWLLVAGEERAILLHRCFSFIITNGFLQSHTIATPVKVQARMFLARHGAKASTEADGGHIP